MLEARHDRSKRTWRWALVLAAVLAGLGGPAFAQHWRGGRGGGPHHGEAHGGHWGGERHWGHGQGPRWERRGGRGPGRWGGPPGGDRAQDGPYAHGPGWRDEGRRQWRRGSYLPPDDQGDVLGDYAKHRLRRPPAGYHWVRMGDRYLLVSSATGLVFDVVPAP